VDWSGEEEDYSSYAIGSEGVNGHGARLITLSGSSGEEHGYAIVPGDFNDDGYTDIAVGAPGYSTDKGRIRIYYGKTDGSGVYTTANVTISATDTMRFGHALAVGDFDGDADGDDIAVGAMRYNNYQGRVFIFYDGGTNGGNETTADVILDGGNVSGQRFGFALVAGNFDDQEGAIDLAVGAPEESSGTGKVYVYYDPTDYATEDDSFTGTSSGEAGYALSKGDFDNTGDADDIVIGIPGDSSNKGMVRIYEDTNSSNTPETFDSTATSEKFGAAVAVGDFEGTGDADDLLVGAPGYSSWRGQAYLFYDGTGGYSGKDLIFASPGIGARFGESVASGNFKADGPGDDNDDIIIGAPGYSTRRGMVRIYYGEDNDNAADLEERGNAGTQDEFGMTVAAAMIVNNGWGGVDLIVGEPDSSDGGSGKTKVYENKDDLNVPEFSTMTIPIATVAALFIVHRRRRWC